MHRAHHSQKKKGKEKTHQFHFAASKKNVEKWGNGKKKGEPKASSGGVGANA